MAFAEKCSSYCCSEERRKWNAGGRKTASAEDLWESTAEGKKKPSTWPVMVGKMSGISEWGAESLAEDEPVVVWNMSRISGVGYRMSLAGAD